MLLQVVVLVLLATGSWAARDAFVFTGADALVSSRYHILSGKKVGMIANPTTIVQNLSHLVDVMHADRSLVNVVAIFGPEHGFRGDRQAGTGADTYIDNRTGEEQGRSPSKPIAGITVYNTYDRSGAELVKIINSSGVDVLVYDIQDVGTRFYTFVWTMWDCMVAASSTNVKSFVVLDRPNPLGGLLMDGPILEPEFSSFIGRLPIPLVHGMTVGELARMFRSIFLPSSSLEVVVVPMYGWRRDMTFEDTGLFWVPPSPNMPTLDTARVYPGMGLLEGTNLSTGRGTTRPFETFGAPFFTWQYVDALQSLELPGMRFRETYYIPTFDRYVNNVTCGAQIYVTGDEFSSLRVGLEVLAMALNMFKDDFGFYDSDFDLHMGTNATRLDLLAGVPVRTIIDKWAAGLVAFAQQRSQFLLY